MKIFEGKNFLVVEDDEMLREIIRDMFESRGAKVTEAINGVVAFTLVLANRYDVVVSDVRMPGGDGITLAKKISELTSHKPLMFICSGFNDLSAERAHELQILKVFEKPFEAEYLIKEIAARLHV